MADEAESLEKLQVMKEIIDSVVKNVPSENIARIEVNWEVMETSDDDLVVPTLVIELSPTGVKTITHLQDLPHIELH